MSSCTITVLPKGSDLSEAFEIRRQVFQVIQGTSAELDFDGQDEAAYQYMVHEGKTPIATARARVLPDGSAKVERVAVVDDVQGKGYGSALMRFIVEHLTEEGIVLITLHAQSHAIDFYKKLGFEVVGEEFEEAAIAHVKMRLKIS